LGSVAVIGSGGSNDFLVTSQSWLNEPYNGTPVAYTKTVEIENLSSNPITIDKGTWPDPHFTAVPAVPGQFPVTVPPSPGKTQFFINYTPDANSLTPLSNRTQGTWTSPNVLASDGSESPRFDSLIGNAVAPAETFLQDTVINDTCANGVDIVTAYFTLSETGTTGGVINRVTQSADSNVFMHLVGTLTSNGETWDPTKQAEPLSQGQSAVISVQYVPPANLDTTVVDYITAVDGNGDTVGGTALKVTVNVVYRAGVTNPTNLTFGPVPYQAPNTPANVALTQKSFQITNTAEAPLTINSIGFQANGNNNAFQVSYNPAGTTFPDTLPIGQTLTVLIDFNDSLYNLSTQQAVFTIATNSCPNMTEALTAYVTHPTPTTSTYVATPILSCDNQTNNVSLINSGVKTDSVNNTFDAADTVISAKWTGAGQYFTFDPAQLVGYVLHGSTNFGAATATNGTPNSVPATGLIPVTFNPPAIPGGIVNYSDMLELVVVNSDNDTVTEDIPVTGIAGGAHVSATSVIANQTHSSDGTSGNVGDAMSLPANVTSMVDAGIPVTVDQLNITGAQLTYIIPNRDLLTLTGSGFQSSNLGWTPIGNKPWYETPAGTGLGADTIIYRITGANVLAGNTTSFGFLMFTVDLDKVGDMTPVTLQSLQLYTGGVGSTTPVESCVDTAVQSQNFSLVLACGDSTLRDVMNGKGSIIQFIAPATPDPVAGGSVTMKYANNGAANLTLAIYDALGNEVARPVNNVFHNAGSWQVTTDVSKLPSGTYTYRLSGTSATGPMAVSNQFVIQR
jgi:hypothetical protein